MEVSRCGLAVGVLRYRCLATSANRHELGLLNSTSKTIPWKKKSLSVRFLFVGRQSRAKASAAAPTPYSLAAAETRRTASRPMGCVGSTPATKDTGGSSGKSSRSRSPSYLLR